MGEALAAHRVAGGVEGWGVDADGALARRHRDDATRDTALAGQADVEEPLAGALIEPRCAQDGQDSLAHRRRHDHVARQGVDPTVGQGGAHHRQVRGGDLDGALMGVDVGGLGGVEPQSAVAREQVGDALVASVRLGLGDVDLFVHGQPATGEGGETVQDHP